MKKNDEFEDVYEDVVIENYGNPDGYFIRINSSIGIIKYKK